MSEIKLTSKAEEKAKKAESLNAFSGIKLLHERRTPFIYGWSRLN